MADAERPVEAEAAGVLGPARSGEVFEDDGIETKDGLS
jgi:hypothetical protein